MTGKVKGPCCPPPGNFPLLLGPWAQTLGQLLGNIRNFNNQAMNSIGTVVGTETQRFIMDNSLPDESTFLKGFNMKSSHSSEQSANVTKSQRNVFFTPVLRPW